MDNININFIIFSAVIWYLVFSAITKKLVWFKPRQIITGASAVFASTGLIIIFGFVVIPIILMESPLLEPFYLVVQFVSAGIPFILFYKLKKKKSKKLD